MQKVPIREMRKAGEINAAAIAYGFEQARPGVTPLEIDEHIDGYIRALGGTPAFKGYTGFPAAACISVNNQVVHTIPGNQPLDKHDVLTIDVGTKWAGAIVDAAETRIIEPDANTPAENHVLVEGGRKCLDAILAILQNGVRLWDIAQTGRREAKSAGITVLPQYTGHGVGAQLHGPPSIFHTTDELQDQVVAGLLNTTLKTDDTVCIEPIVKLGPSTVTFCKSDGWTIVTGDGNKSAHFEHTILITDDGYEVLC